MSLIVARTLNQKISERTTVMLRPLRVGADAKEHDRPTSRDHVEVHCTQTADGHWECGCYDYDAGTCGPC